MQSVISNAANLAADVIIEAFNPVLMPSEVPDARELIAETVEAAIAAAFIRVRELNVTPSLN